jgi:hypothetical protein
LVPVCFPSIFLFPYLFVRKDPTLFHFLETKRIMPKVLFDVTRTSFFPKGVKGSKFPKFEAVVLPKGEREGHEVGKFAACFILVLCFAYSLTMKMGAICYSETSVAFNRPTWRYIPEHRNLYF